MPGELRTVIPFLYDNPLLGLTCPSYPSGNSTYNPVLINILSNGFNKTGADKLALKSTPAENLVAYSGVSCCDLFKIKKIRLFLS